MDEEFIFYLLRIEKNQFVKDSMIPSNVIGPSRSFMRYKKNYSQVVGEGLDPLSKKKNGRFQIPIIIPIPNKYLSAHAQQKGFLGKTRSKVLRS